MSQPPISSLDSNQLLIAEYNYIAQTAFQANEDRSRYLCFYLVSVGSLVAAILSAQSVALPALNWGFAVLFLTVAFAGLLTLLQLARLRLPWFSSMKAMNQIKEYYLIHATDLPHLAAAIAWRADDLPPILKIRSLSFLTALQVALLASINMGAALLWAGLALQRWWWFGAILSALAFCAIQLWLYRRMLL